MAHTDLPVDPTDLSEREQAVLAKALEQFAKTANWVTYRSIERAFPHDWRANEIAVRLATIGLLEEYSASVRPTLRGMSREQEKFRDVFESLDAVFCTARDAYKADADALTDAAVLFPEDKSLRRKLHISLRSLSRHLQIGSEAADGTITRLDLRSLVREYTTLAAIVQAQIDEAMPTPQPTSQAAKKQGTKRTRPATHDSPITQLRAAVRDAKNEDERNRRRYIKLGKELTAHCRRAHVGHHTSNFVLAESGDETGYGHLGVGPEGLFLAYRTNTEDLEDGLNNIPEPRSFHEFSPETWSVEWLRRIAAEHKFDELIEGLRSKAQSIAVSKHRTKEATPQTREPDESPTRARGAAMSKDKSVGEIEAYLSKTNVDVLILTALTEEQQVVHAVLQRCARYVSAYGALPNRVTLYEYVCKDGAQYLLATASTHDMGAVAMSGFATSLLASGVRPECAVLVGIAASLTPDELDIGDVPVASAVFSADDIKVENGTLTFRTQGSQADHLMRVAAGSLREQRASHGAWRAECLNVVTGVAEDLSADGLRRRPVTVPADVRSPRLVVEPGVGGPFLIADADFGKALRKGSPTVAPLHPKIAWAEMEAHGFMRAMHAAAVPAIVLKGISDSGDADKARLERETGGFFRAYACSNSVVAVLHLLAQSPRGAIPLDRRLGAPTSSAQAAPSVAVAASGLRAPATLPRPSRSAALDVWQEKLEFLRVEQARAVEADMKFRLKYLIAEAEERVRALSTETST